MRTGVSAPLALAEGCFETTEKSRGMLNSIHGWQPCVGVRQLYVIPLSWCDFMSFIHQFAAANQRQKPGLVWDQKLTMKAKSERMIFCYLGYSKIIVKGEVVGMLLVTTESIVMLNDYWGLCY